MSLTFLKMNGLGNDFVVFDLRAAPEQAGLLTPEVLRRVANRRRGVGCDQVIVLTPAKGAAPDAQMRIFNPDGSEAEACGNATRCVAQLIGAGGAGEDLAIHTVAGALACRIEGDGRVSVDMGPPRLGWQDIPLSQEQNTSALDLSIGPVGAPDLSQPSAVSMGNPHCVFFVEDVTAHDLGAIGPLVETHPLFPARTNVELAEIRSAAELRLRVWERGTGITPACGSGACAAVVAAARRGLTERSVRVLLDGGALDIEWDAQDRVRMTGPTAVSFTGTLDDALLSGEAAHV